MNLAAVLEVPVDYPSIGARPDPRFVRAERMCNEERADAARLLRHGAAVMRDLLAAAKVKPDAPAARAAMAWLARLEAERGETIGPDDAPARAPFAMPPGARAQA
jgi:hypothetical protein